MGAGQANRERSWTCQGLHPRGPWLRLVYLKDDMETTWSYNRRVTARIRDTGGQGSLPTPFSQILGLNLRDLPTAYRWPTNGDGGTYVHSSRHTPHTLRINTALGWALGTLRINTPLRPRLIRDSQTLAWTLDLAWTA